MSYCKSDHQYVDKWNKQKKSHEPNCTLNNPGAESTNLSPFNCYILLQSSFYDALPNFHSKRDHSHMHHSPNLGNIHLFYIFLVQYTVLRKMTSKATVNMIHTVQVSYLYSWNLYCTCQSLGNCLANKYLRDRYILESLSLTNKCLVDVNPS